MAKYIKIEGEGKYWLDRLYSGGPHQVSDEVFAEADALMRAGAPLSAFESAEELEPEDGSKVRAARQEEREALTLRDIKEGSERPPDPEPEPHVPAQLPAPPEPEAFPCDVENCDRVGDKAYKNAAALERHKEKNHPAPAPEAPAPEPPPGEPDGNS